MADYDPSRPSTFLQYLDAYGWAMCQYLPASDISWQEPTPELVQDILHNPDDAGYMVECDLTVPPALQDHFKDYPLAPEKLSVTEHMLSPHQQHLANKLSVSIPCTCSIY